MQVDAVVEITGPAPQHWRCTLGLACALLLQGFGLAPGNALLPLRHGACGEDAVTPC